MTVCAAVLVAGAAAAQETPSFPARDLPAAYDTYPRLSFHDVSLGYGVMPINDVTGIMDDLLPSLVGTGGEVTFARLRAIAFSTERKLLRSVTLFDVYEGDKLPAGKKSYALGFVLQDRERTLTDQIIDRVMNNLLVQFEKQAGAVVRV